MRLQQRCHFHEEILHFIISCFQSEIGISYNIEFLKHFQRISNIWDEEQKKREDNERVQSSISHQIEDLTCLSSFTFCLRFFDIILEITVCLEHIRSSRTYTYQYHVYIFNENHWYLNDMQCYYQNFEFQTGSNNVSSQFLNKSERHKISHLISKDENATSICISLFK